MGNMKLGTRIGLGFGMLILIACALGILAIWQMKGVEGDSKMLATEYVPELDVANQIRGISNRIMYAMRGYAFTEDSTYYEEANKEQTQMESAIKSADELADKAIHLKALKGQVEKVRNERNRFQSSVQESVKIIETLKSLRKTLDENATKYMDQCAAFLGVQNEALQTVLLERTKKIDLASDLVGIAAKVRVANFKSQATGDTVLMRQAIQGLREMDGILDEIRKLSTDAEDIKKADDAQKAKNAYSEAMEDYLKAGAGSASLASIREQMDKEAQIFVKNCDEYFAGQQQKLKNNINDRVTKINMANEVIDVGNAIRIHTQKSQAQRDPSLMKAGIDLFQKVDQLLTELRKITKQKANLQQIDDTQKYGNAYKDAMSEFLTLWLKLQDLQTNQNAIGKEMINACIVTADAAMDSTKEIAEGAMSALSFASTVLIIGLLIALVIGCLLAYFITTAITKPVNRIIEGLTEAGDQVASAAGQVSSSSQTLAEGASEQAASIEETSSSLEQMSSMTKQNADNAKQADNLMKESSQIVTRANGSMNQLTKSMEDISKSSEETSKIIKTIDEIAFQTNLLALNAAVEAARAGEAGAGFAVVADEVRNLAMRAAEAAKNTANLIEGSVKKIKEGSDLVDNTNTAFTEVAKSSTKVGELVSEIAAASNEQAQGIEQINKAISEMDKVTQQSAANAEESASASEEMNAQAAQLKGFVDELITLVGGSESSARSHTQSYQQHQVKQPRLAGPKRSTKIRTKNAGHTLGHAVKNQASEAIPFDDDFKDF